MIEIEHLSTSGASSIIHDTLGQHTDQGGFAAVDITNDSDSHVILLAHSQRRLDLVKAAFESFDLLIFLIFAEGSIGVLSLSSRLSFGLFLRIGWLLCYFHRVQDIREGLRLLG